MKVKTLQVAWRGDQVTMSYDGPAISDLEFGHGQGTNDLVVHFAEPGMDQPRLLGVAPPPFPDRPLVWAVSDSNVEGDDSIVGRFSTRQEAEACIVGLDFLDPASVHAGRFSISGPDGPVYP